MHYVLLDIEPFNCRVLLEDLGSARLIARRLGLTFFLCLEDRVSIGIGWLLGVVLLVDLMDDCAFILERRLQLLGLQGSFRP